MYGGFHEDKNSFSELFKNSSSRVKVEELHSSHSMPFVPSSSQSQKRDIHGDT